MRRFRSILGGITASATGFVNGQASATGTPLALAGTSAPAPAAGQIHNNAVPLSLQSAANLSAISYTVIGTDRRGNPIQEIIVGPNANTVSGHLLFGSITSITPNGTNAGVINIGWLGINLGPWLITAFHLSAVNAQPLIAGNFDVMTTTYDLIDPTVFLPQGGSGTPSGDINDGAGVMNTGYGSGPFVSSLPWPLVPASLQAACPQLLSTVNCLPEDDGTWSGMVAAPNSFTTSATQAVGANTATEVRLDPVAAFAWRIRTSTAGVLVQLDCNLVRAALS